MKNKLTALALTLAMMLVSLFAFSACGDEPEDNTPTHTHTYESKWTYDSDSHWKKATCGHDDERGSLGTHSDSASDSDELCDSCGYNMHEHTVDTEWTYNNESHWHIYTCCPEVLITPEAHVGFADDGICDVCENHVHFHDGTWESDEDGHWHEATCEHTDVKVSFAEHKGMYDCVCDVCGYVDHSYETDWDKNANGHWHNANCSHYSEKTPIESHDMKNGKCSVCGWEDPNDGTIELPPVKA